MLYYYKIPNGEFCFEQNNDTLETPLSKKDIKELKSKAFKFFKNWTNEPILSDSQKERRKERRILSIHRVENGEHQLIQEL